jgi:hypothetical protein
MKTEEDGSNINLPQETLDNNQTYKTSEPLQSNQNNYEETPRDSQSDISLFNQTYVGSVFNDGGEDPDSNDDLFENFTTPNEEAEFNSQTQIINK